MGLVRDKDCSLETQEGRKCPDACDWGLWRLSSRPGVTMPPGTSPHKPQEICRKGLQDESRRSSKMTN
jgi:hypothetical protein